MKPLDKCIPIRSKSDRKNEITRLETSLGSMLARLGIQVDREDVSLIEEVPEVPEVPEPVEPVVVRAVRKTESCGDKLGSVESLKPAPVVVEEPKMESYVFRLMKTRAGFIGVSRGQVTPKKYQREAFEEQVIEIPRTYDPNDPGLANLSPAQLERLKALAHMKDNDIPMQPDQQAELAALLDLMKNGVPVDGRHPGMVNLTPE